MSAGARLAGFVVGLAAIALLGFGLGRLLDVSAPGGEAGATAMDAHMGAGEAGGHGAAGSGPAGRACPASCRAVIPPYPAPRRQRRGLLPSKVAWANILMRH